MVRSVTFEIRWHDTQPIYGCSFQSTTPAHLRRVLDHNAAQAAGLPPGKTLADAADEAASSSSMTAAGAGASCSKSALPPVMAGGQSWRFATAGGDNNARIWQVHPNIPSPAALKAAAANAGGSSALPAPHPPRVEYLATLKRHSGVVNCVRFCPRGELLATTGDDGMVLFWVPSEGPATGFGSSSVALDDDGDAEYAKEHWRLRSMARTSSSEIYDMAWAPDGESIVVGGTDFVARIINAHDGSIMREISEHNHYVQGVAWDPLNELIATQSSDRSVHVHTLERASSGREAGAITGVQTISRSSRMDLHRRSGSGSGHALAGAASASSSAAGNGAGSFVWDPSAKPPMRRASSHASHASDSDRERDYGVPRAAVDRREKQRSSTPHDVARPSSAASGAAAQASGAVASSASTPAGSGIARAATPTPLHIPQSPAVSASGGGGGGGGASSSHAMNPPQHTPSRRSSFSGSQAEGMLSPMTSTTSLAPASAPPPKSSAAAGHDAATRAVRRSVSRTAGSGTPRSPSPVPPLPAIRAPPSPKQRMANAVGNGSLARAGMKMYGDENFSGFFRRLAFSPDGALLVTPSGVFEAPGLPQSPTVPNAAAGSSATAALDLRASPALGLGIGSPAPPPGTGMGTSASATAAAATSSVKSTVYLYGRANLLHKSSTPLAHLPGHKTASLVVRFSPILYELRAGAKGGADEGGDGGVAPHPTVPLEVGKQKTVALESAASRAGGVASSSSVDAAPETHAQAASMIGLPYRMVFAVATHDSVWIYDTQQGGPLCCFSNMHYASFTDLTWSPDGQTLMMCSTDGYCSVVVFDYEELGTPRPYKDQPALQNWTPPASASQPPGVAAMRKSSSAGISPSPVHAQATPLSASSSSSAAAADAEHASHVFSALGLGLDAKMNPPTPASAAAAGSSSGAGAARAAEEGEGAAGEAEQPKKKRRIALTLEGPVGS